MAKRNDWSKKKSAAVMLGLSMGVGAIASPALTVEAANVLSDEAYAKALADTVSQTVEFPEVYPDEALAPLSDEEISARVERLLFM
ncbi:MAG: hypothetical protein IKW81_12210 [Pseudobutyrivibrio sp.]|nr:hypothetical protein [Pseudobutyrivibrio sp.]